MLLDTIAAEISALQARVARLEGRHGSVPVPSAPARALDIEAALDIIGWSVTGLAARVGMSETAVRARISRGTVPAEILAWVEEIAGYIGAHPPPLWK